MLRQIIFLVLTLFFTSANAQCMDHFKLAQDFNPDSYVYVLLKAALEATVESDGPFRISQVPTSMKRNRALQELIETTSINIHVAASRTEWESNSIPVRIPVIKGLLGYRIFLIHKDNEQLFKKIQTLTELKKLRVGTGLQWTTTAVLQKTGFNVITGSDYDDLFRMLEAKRFDYFPRGINEIYFELDNKQTKHDSLCVESTLALYFPTPSYFFVSPKLPHLADRVRRGLEILIKTGVFDTMFAAEFGESIAQAQLERRNVLVIKNPLLSEKTPFHRAELWFTP
nr:hypothetical protein [uncultured Pseudodesulfovibrio sp.]